ncbi:MAG: T9SS type A sorting domain-containing protein [Ferruginibacter sp.]
MKEFNKNKSLSVMIRSIKKIKIILLIPAMIFSLHVSAQNFIVNTTTDTHAVAPGTNALDGSGNISLRSAMEASTALAGTHIITFNATVVTAGVLNISLGSMTVGNPAAGNNITVSGPGMNALTINQTTAARVFTTALGAVTFKVQDLTLNYTGPAASVATYSGGGGAILAGGIGAATTFINCKFTNFRNQIGNGGAVSVSTSNVHSLVVTNCIFSNNACGGGGGGLSYNGNGTAVITGCTFSNDSTGMVGSNTGGSGGALSVTGSGSGGVYTVTQCTFTNNLVKSTAQGGAIMNTNGTLNLQYNRFVNNTALVPANGNTLAQAGGGTVNIINANDNWWGVNTGPAANDAVVLAAGGTINLTTWLQLRNISAAATVCPSGGGTNTTVVTADILGRNSGGPIAASNLVGLAAFPSPAATVFSSPVLGTLSSASTQFVNGIATVTYTAGSTGGTGSVIATADNQPVTANITIPSAPVITPVSSSVCQGSSGNVVNGPAGASTYAWSMTNGTITSATNGQNITYAAGSASPMVLTLTITTAAGCTLTNTANVTANITNTLVGTAGGSQVCVNAPVVAAGTIYTDASCNPVAKILPSGAFPVTGTVNTCVKIDATVQTLNTQPYVQRHYDITPATGAATATATLTLYFTQAEFNSYNTARGTYPALPTGSADAAGIANLKVTQYHGTGTAPGNYSGLSVVIDPVDANVVYNSGAARWEITFDVAGFSGFYISTGQYAVPLLLINFSGQNNGNQNLLEWTTAQELNSSYFELQRSSDGNNFSAVSNIIASGNSSSNKTYHYADNISNIPLPVYYYRLKMVDRDGQFTYSAVAKIRVNSKAGFAVEVSPNPFKDQLKANIESMQNEDAVIVLSDMSGKVLIRQTASLKKGTNAIDINGTKQFVTGAYMLTVSTSQNRQTLKLIKE